MALAIKPLDETMGSTVTGLVRARPASRANALYLSTDRLERIIERVCAECDAPFDALRAQVTRPWFQDLHECRSGTMLRRDSRRSAHHANTRFPHDAKRLSWRKILAARTSA